RLGDSWRPPMARRRATQARAKGLACWRAMGLRRTTSPPFRGGGSIARDVHLDLQLPVALVDLHGAAVGNLAREQLLGQRILQVALHRALEGPRAVDRIVADPPEPAPRGVGQIEHDLAVLEQL